MKARTLGLLAILGASATMAGHVLRAQDIIVVTGTIQGTVSSLSLPMTQVQVIASPQFAGSSTSTTTPFVQAGSASTPYSLLVGLPQTGTGGFNVFATIFSDANRDSLRPTALPITVSSGSPATLDYTLPEVGYIAPVFSITNAPDATVTSASLSASFNAPGISESASTNGNLAAVSSFAVIPRANIHVSGSVRLSNGVTRSLQGRFIDVSAGVPTEILYTVDGTPPPPPPPPPPTNGSIGGTIAFTGDMPVQRFELQANGPTFRSIVQQPPSIDGAYVLTSLAAGTYSMIARVRMNNFDDFLQLPPSAFSPSQSGLTVADSQTTVNISVPQAFLNGTLLLGGGATLVPFLTSGTISAGGLAGTGAVGASATDQLQVATRAIDLVLTPGTWRINGISMNFSRPAPGLNGSLSYTPVQLNPTLTLEPNATLHHDVPLDLGELTLTITSAGGQTFSNPRVDGNCIQRDAANMIQYQSSFSFNTFNQNNVLQGSVTLVSTSGRCTLTPRVVVGTQTLTLPAVTIDLVAGASQTVDVGGPALTITSPPPGLVTSSFVTVSGRATDDVAVASVLVDGQPASISSANNPADPREIVFSRFISSLVRGPNVITTMASDTSSPAKTATDTRTLCFDAQLPTLIVIAPVNGSTFAASVTVTGTASDDAGIQKITINGTDAPLTPTGGPNGEVAFTASAPLSVGANTVTVVATDICNRTNTVARTVTREQGVPTVLTVAPAAGVFGGNVTLTAMLTASGSPVGGKTVLFILNGAQAGATTNAQGVATVSLSLAGLGVGSFQAAISAAFAQDATHLASSATGDLTVGKATAILAVTGLLYRYDGAPKAATVTTTPVGLGSVSVLYDGSPALPANAGDYVVSASLENPNYEAAPAGGTLTIERAPATITLASLNQIYTGAARLATVSSNPAGLQGIAVTYDGVPSAPVNAGSYAVVASLANPNYEAPDAHGTLRVEKGTATLLLASLAHTYDGSPKTAAVTTSPAELAGVTVTYDSGTVPPVNAGSYTVAAALDNANYQAASPQGTLVINKAAQAIAFAPLAPATFGDAPVGLGATATSGLPVTFSASGSCTLSGATLTLTAGGSCSVTGTQPGNGNYHAAPPVMRAFNVAWPWSGVLPPVNVDGTSVFKLNSTVPVKFGLTGPAAGLSTLMARIYLGKVSSGVLGSELEPVSTSAADAGSAFRYDPTSDQYIFNLGTKSLSQGTWQVRIDLGDGSTHLVLISLKK